MNINELPSKVSVVWQVGQVSVADRAALLRQRPTTVWFTGLSGAGKSTLAFALEHRLIALGHPCFVLDGDNVRHGINKDLGFSPDDRAENIRRIAEVAKLMNQAGLIVISAFISPYLVDREIARQIIGNDKFLEIHVNTAMDICEQRDIKGLYKLAREGKISEFTGVTAPYEAPVSADLSIDTNTDGVERGVDALIKLLYIEEAPPK